MLNTQLAYDKASMEQTYPYVSRAAAEATARNLLASKSFAQFKDYLPTAVANRYAQGVSTAATNEAGRQYATADQMRAARAGFNYQGSAMSLSFG